MPAKKHSSIKNRHSTKEEIDAEETAEQSLTPTVDLTDAPPQALTGHALASKEWKRILALYKSTKSHKEGLPIVTPFDQNTLTQYCLAIEEEIGLIIKVREFDKASQDLLKQAQRMRPNTKNLKEWVSMWEQTNALTEKFKALDARLDGKRKLIHTLAQSLYLTPRSRAGVAPTTEAPKKKDGFGDEFDN